jgi:hypothetical protein
MGSRDPKRHKLSRATPLNFTKHGARNFAPPPAHEEATCGRTIHERHEYSDRHGHNHTHVQPTTRHSLPVMLGSFLAYHFVSV